MNNCHFFPKVVSAGMRDIKVFKNILILSVQLFPYYPVIALLKIQEVHCIHIDFCKLEDNDLCFQVSPTTDMIVKLLQFDSFVF